MSQPLKRLLDISVELVGWVLYAIALPLSPMGLALFILSGHGKTVSYEELFGGTEVFLLCITVFATTHVDLEKSKIDFSRKVQYKVLKMFVFPTAVVIAMLFGVVFLNSFVSNCSSCDRNSIAGTMEVSSDEIVPALLVVPKSHIANYAVILGIFTSVICGWLRIMLIASEFSEPRS